MKQATLARCDECGALYPVRPQDQGLGDGVRRTFLSCPNDHEVTICYTDETLRAAGARLARLQANIAENPSPCAVKKLQEAVARYRRRFDAFNRKMGVTHG